MRSLKIFAVLLTVVAAAGCSQDSPTAVVSADLAPEFAQAGNIQMVPFRAAYEAPAGFTPVAPTVCPSELADITTGGGQATRLGRFTGETFSCVNLATLQAHGQFTFTGADGSRVMGTYMLQGTPPVNGVITFIDTPFTVTGGTGRFAGAMGGGTVSGSVDLVTGELVLHFDGQISSVGSLRRN